MSLTDAAGLAGVFAILVAYAGAALGKLDPQRPISLLCNLIGASTILWSLLTADFNLSATAMEGSWVLVSAVYEGFVSTYQRRTRDLLRLATGGSGRLPEGELHPDLVNRLTQECVRTAQSVLAMCIRATDYLPPVDPTFSDYLRAMVTADFARTAYSLGIRMR